MKKKNSGKKIAFLTLLLLRTDNLNDVVGVLEICLFSCSIKTFWTLSSSLNKEYVLNLITLIDKKNNNPVCTYLYTIKEHLKKMYFIFVFLFT